MRGRGRDGRGGGPDERHEGGAGAGALVWRRGCGGGPGDCLAWRAGAADWREAQV